MVVGEQLLQLLREAGHVLGVAVGNLQGTGQEKALQHTCSSLTGLARGTQAVNLIVGISPSTGCHSPYCGAGARGSPAPGTSAARQAPYSACPAGR